MKTRDAIIELIKSGITSQKEMASKLGISASAVNKHMKQLSLEGIIEWERNKAWTLKAQGVEARPAAITEGQTKMVEILRTNGQPMTQTQLAKAMNIKDPSAYEMIRILQAKGLLTRTNKSYSLVPAP